MTNNILICVSGLTPQIVTETLYCLSKQNKIPIDELYIFTTKKGRDVIIGTDKELSTPKIPLKNEIINLCNKYKLKLPKFENNDEHIIVAKEESVELYDIRTDKHNILFPNKICEVIKNLTEEKNNIIYCSISGGRKSMSVHLAFAMSLYGRENDKLFHVLTNEENEFKEFYPRNRKEDKALILSEIPFVRLRHFSLLKTKAKTKYADIVRYTQNQLRIISDNRKILLKAEQKEICFGSNTIKLEPLEFAIYFKLVEFKLEGKEKLSIHTIISKEFANDVAEFIKEKYPYYNFNEIIRNPWWQNGFTPENFRSKRAKINSKICNLINDETISTLYIIDSQRDYGQTLYFVTADKSRFQIEY